ncbi:GNAT family N-acetyltransferase [Vibrio sp. SM6]|uniref:GNAT family N-acetyltransferase n=1 Tax=Vibrio agarilyticus TaxID=2726741 RepID=A0A7X8TN23_9VIBR|nr:GNAT family N-acetyltransferase [Vibrio agarilyticus]NLS11765.1 GNAT family N-acetyltransferase [Vibrio agarilyticus]
MDVTIRAAQPSDAKGVTALFDQPLVQRFTLQLPFPSETTWQQRLSETDQHSYSYVAELDHRIVGQIGLHLSANPRTRHCASIGIAVHDDFHGQGIGSQLLASIVDLADNWLNLDRLQLEVNSDNQAAIALYKKFHFEIEGCAKASCFRAGRYVDTFFMARLSPRIR